MYHWKVSFTRRGMEPPMPFGRTHAIVCAETREEAKSIVPASSGFKITASKTNAPTTFGYHCKCGSVK